MCVCVALKVPYFDSASCPSGAFQGCKGLALADKKVVNEVAAGTA